MAVAAEELEERLSRLEDAVARIERLLAAGPPAVAEEWLGAPAAARSLGVTLRTLYRILDGGELRSYRAGRVLRLKGNDIEAWLEGQRVRPGELSRLYQLGKGDALTD
jgi:excisionase family DNA binding protein